MARLDYKEALAYTQSYTEPVEYYLDWPFILTPALLLLMFFIYKIIR